MCSVSRLRAGPGHCLVGWEGLLIRLGWWGGDWHPQREAWRAPVCPRTPVPLRPRAGHCPPASRAPGWPLPQALLFPPQDAAPARSHKPQRQDGGPGTPGGLGCGVPVLSTASSQEGSRAAPGSPALSRGQRVWGCHPHPIGLPAGSIQAEPLVAHPSPAWPWAAGEAWAAAVSVRWSWTSASAHLPAAESLGPALPRGPRLCALAPPSPGSGACFASE